MPYTITSDTVGLAVGPVSETAMNVHEALSKARQAVPVTIIRNVDGQVYCDLGFNELRLASHRMILRGQASVSAAKRRVLVVILWTAKASNLSVSVLLVANRCTSPGPFQGLEGFRSWRLTSAKNVES
jgi:hypothetical protein